MKIINQIVASYVGSLLAILATLLFADLGWLPFSSINMVIF